MGLRSRLTVMTTPRDLEGQKGLPSVSREEQCPSPGGLGQQQRARGGNSLHAPKVLVPQ